MNYKLLMCGLLLGTASISAMAQSDLLKFDPSRFKIGRAHV